MKNPKIYMRVIAVLLVLVMIVPFFASCSDKKKKGSGDDTSKDTKVNTLTGEVGADLMERFDVTYWREEAQRLVTGDYVYQGESQAPKSFEDFENTLGKGGIVKSLRLYLKDHAKLYGKTVKKVCFTVEADCDTSVYFKGYLSYGRKDGEKAFQNFETVGKQISLKAGEKTEVEIEFDMKKEIDSDASIVVGFLQDESGEVDHDSWQEWHLTNYKITDLKVIAK